VWKLSIIQKTKNLKQTEKNIPLLEGSFHAALDDDFNTPAALAVIFSYISLCESTFATLSSKDAQRIQKTIITLLNSLGLSLTKKPKIPASILRLNTQREKKRAYKQFIQADALRNQMLQVGYEVEDTPWGPFVTPSNSFIKNSKHQAPNNK
jgi:cysteinyl-tRNA synthetase